MTVDSAGGTKQMRKDWPDDCSAAIEYDTEIEWLLKLAGDPNWKRYAWEKAKRLEAEFPQMWSGIAEDLKQRVLKA